MVMEPKYYAEEVIGHPNHHLRIWLDSQGDISPWQRRAISSKKEHHFLNSGNDFQGIYIYTGVSMEVSN